MPFNLPLLQDAKGLRGQRVLLRLDLNVPILNGQVREAYRVERAAQTLSFLRAQGARTCIIGHIESKETQSLRPVFDYLASRIPLVFAETTAAAREALAEMREGEFVLLQNLRMWEGEKQNADALARELASLGDLFVNEAFSASHRAHASTVGAPRHLPHYAGFLFAEEVAHLSRAFSPARPALCIIGGAKFETKIPLITKFLSIADSVYLCGALANDIYRARGYETGISLVSVSPPEAAMATDPKLIVPADIVVQKGNERKAKSADTVAKDEKIVDAGPEALSDLAALVEKARFVLWNGPLGEYESGFDAGTIALAQMLAESDAEVIIGGGDSLAVVSKLGLLERFSFVSTGGGAMLQFLADGTLPGIEALTH